MGKQLVVTVAVYRCPDCASLRFEDSRAKKSERYSRFGKSYPCGCGWRGNDWKFLGYLEMSLLKIRGKR